MGAQSIAAEGLLRALGQRGWSIGVAESLTGGLLTAALVAVPGASAHVRGGVVAYATDVKHSLLGVDAGLLEREGPVHPDVAAQMADGARRATGRDGVPADVGLSTTGIAGPASADGQPVGTVHVGLSTPEGTRVLSLHLVGSREQIREDAVLQALRLGLDVVRPSG